jgi:light-regulated signal transduction histidine kinase (bacteriophytochrome)
VRGVDIVAITHTPIDLTVCDRELFHIPDSIQPHGMMLIVETNGLAVRHVAGDVEHSLG